MQNKPALEVAKLAVRSKICPDCYQRPVGSESLGLVARSCEAHCTIFQSLPLLLTATQQTPAEMSLDRVMREFVCKGCQASPTAGDFCAEGLTRTCPLSRYAATVLQILSSIQEK
jgi:hypothetical protein